MSEEGEPLVLVLWFSRISVCYGKDSSEPPMSDHVEGKTPRRGRKKTMVLMIMVKGLLLLVVVLQFYIPTSFNSFHHTLTTRNVGICHLPFAIWQ